MKFILSLLLAPVVILAQIFVWEHLTPAILDMEFSLLAVIYIALKAPLIQGGLLSFVLGYFLDALVGRTQGLHTFFYVLFFLFTRTASRAVDVHATALTMGLVFSTALIKGCFFLGYLHWEGGIDWWSELSSVTVPQALILALISPYLFRLFDRYNIVSTYERQQ